MRCPSALLPEIVRYGTARPPPDRVSYNRTLMATLEQQIGQLLIVGIDGSVFDSQTEDFLREVKPGGVIFFQRNILSASGFFYLVRQVREFLQSLAPAPPFLALDLEGGSVDRLRDVLAPLPAVRDVAAAGMGRKLGRIAGKEVAAFFLNVDFAPVLDLASSESSAVLGRRTAGAFPTDVVRFAKEFLIGLNETGVIGCGKHFPGLGGGKVDSHKQLPLIERTEAELWESDLAPFRELAPELPMIMVAHAFYPVLEPSPRTPATLSPRIVTELLKQRIGYRGLVIADDLEMGGVLEGRSMETAAVAAIRAGCEVLLLCGPSVNSRRTYDALVQAAKGNSDFANIIATVVEKVAISKQRLPVASSSDPPPDFEGLASEIRQFSAEVRQRIESPQAIRRS